MSQPSNDMAMVERVLQRLLQGESAPAVSTSTRTTLRRAEQQRLALGVSVLAVSFAAMGGFGPLGARFMLSTGLIWSGSLLIALFGLRSSWAWDKLRGQDLGAMLGFLSAIVLALVLAAMQWHTHASHAAIVAHTAPWAGTQGCFLTSAVIASVVMLGAKLWPARLRRVDPIRPHARGAWNAMLAAGGSGLIVHLHCMYADAGHLVLGHWAVLPLFAGVGAWLGRRSTVAKQQRT